MKTQFFHLLGSDQRSYFWRLLTVTSLASNWVTRKQDQCVYIPDSVLGWSVLFSWSSCSMEPVAVTDIPFRWSYRILLLLISQRIACIYSRRGPMGTTGIIVAFFLFPVSSMVDMTGWETDSGVFLKGILFTPDGIIPLSYLILGARDAVILFISDRHNQ